MMNVQESQDPVLEIWANRGSHGDEFWALAHLLSIGTTCWQSQEANEMVREPCKCLEVQNQFTTFLCFFQVLFSLLRLQNLVIFVCKCSLYTEEWIRVQIML